MGSVKKLINRQMALNCSVPWQISISEDKMLFLWFLFASGLKRNLNSTVETILIPKEFKGGNVPFNDTAIYFSL